MDDHNDSRITSESRSQTQLPARIIFVIIALSLAFGLWFGTDELIRRSHASLLPAMPDLSRERVPVVEQITTADRNARGNPLSAAYIGALAKRYHANAYSNHARVCYELARKLEPENWRWSYYLILLHEEIGDTQIALVALREFVGLKDNLALAWFRLGEAEFNVGRDEKASRAFSRAAQLANSASSASLRRKPFFPLESYATVGRARIAFRRNRYEDIEPLLLPVVERSPMFGAAHRLLGNSYQKIGREAEASHHLNLALGCGPYSPPVDPLVDDLTTLSRSPAFLLKEAGVAYNKGDADWAETTLRRGLKLYPDDEDILGEWTLLLCRLHRLQEALPLLDRFLALPPTHHATPSKIGTELISQNQLAKAIECFRLAVELQPAHPANHLNLGMALARSGRLEEAEGYFRETLLRDPLSYIAQRNLATVLFDQSRYDKAIEQYTAALMVKPEDADGRFRLGRALELTQRYDEAIREYREVLDLDPDHVRCLDRLAQILSAREQHEEALSLARHLADVGKQFPQAHYTLARVAFAAGDIQLARKHCNLALQLDPNFAPAQTLLDQLGE